PLLRPTLSPYTTLFRSLLAFRLPIWAGGHVGVAPGDWPDDRTRPGWRRSVMKKVIGMAVALLLVFAVGRAWTEEIKGKIKSLDTDRKSTRLNSSHQIIS